MRIRSIRGCAENWCKACSQCCELVVTTTDLVIFASELNVRTASTTHSPTPTSRKHRIWFWAKRIATVAFFALMITLLIRMEKQIDWREVAIALRSFGIKTLTISAVTALCGYLLYSTFDLFGNRYIKNRLPTALVMTIAFVCYAFTQTLTAWVGGIAMRYRLYSRFGVEKSAIAQIFGISILTNWIGYFVLAGALCVSGVIRTPDNWPIGVNTVRIIGTFLFLPVIFFLWSGYRFPDQGRKVFGQEWRLPNLGIGLLQIVLGACNWLIMAAVIFILLQNRVDYSVVLGALLLSSVAAVIVHVPAGLGVIEAVFVALLYDSLDRNQILAALVCYRAVYFLFPLLIAAVLYMGLELRGARRTQSLSANTE